MLILRQIATNILPISDSPGPKQNFWLPGAIYGNMWVSPKNRGILLIKGYWFLGEHLKWKNWEKSCWQVVL
jgi:hypothetical protein